MIRQFFTWWGRELAALLPESWMRSSESGANVLEITLSEDFVDYRHRTGGESEQLGSFERNKNASGSAVSAMSASARESLHAVLRGLRPKKVRCEVRADDRLRLRKSVSLPLAAEENLEQVLAFEMERHTPFHADEVYFDYRVVSRDAKSRRLDVEFLVMRKATVDDALSVISEWGVRASTGVFDGKSEVLLFLPEEYRGTAAPRINRLLLAANVAAVTFALLLPIQRQETYLDELRASVDEARTRAMSSAEIQQRIDTLRKDLTLLAGARSGAGSAVELIEELTRLLPDDTWLNRLEIRDGEVHFQGFSQAASALVGKVEASELFRDARFGSPITRDVRTGRERFHVSAKLAPRHQGLAKAKGATDREG